MANFALLHGIHNGIGYAQHRIVGKADVDRVERFFRLKSGQVQGFLNHVLEVRNAVFLPW